MPDYNVKTKVLQHMLSQQRNSDPNVDGTIWYKEQGLYRPIQVGISSAKGGVGKTTLAAWLAYLSAKSGLKTAAVEFNWINNPNLVSIVFQDIKEKNRIRSFVTKKGIDPSLYSQSISCPNLSYFLIRNDDWINGMTIDNDKKTLNAQMKIIEGLKNSNYGIVIYDFPNYASKQMGLEPLIETDSRVIVSQRGDASMSTIPKIVKEIIELTKEEGYYEETKKQKLLIINRIEEESSTLKRILARPLDELKIDKTKREFENLRPHLQEKNFFGEYVYFIQERPEIEKATGPGNIMSLNADGIREFKSTTQNLVADIISHAINYQKQERESK